MHTQTTDLRTICYSQLPGLVERNNTALRECDAAISREHVHANVKICIHAGISPINVIYFC